ncbi:hypothetical protein N7499_011303 [Penicillium canescens]|uniref:Uncharacterized protein n=1 Tax=Penicillium canescens TaxID=5083 RepID=A0AAD6IKG9_PENCN|nr:uncharacterized protein N7446_006560 [Penicillium canescens]KAJ6051923.1 hypothetical protein N7460_002457 [Penicillium canescens]KAJ6062440.1 hypothetical protein N7446_006560 [Penicillium canescens]KAJ6065687.1 hypothetical protein N7444_001340 [Penicillium canescens]KAJ6069416.1 hypothetical protein N7499_011303 [Penicillium canescens]KAJ6182532.1 hypothetical protein N7485_001174 [Penicillium canescens]
MSNYVIQFDDLDSFESNGETVTTTLNEHGANFTNAPETFPPVFIVFGVDDDAVEELKNMDGISVSEQD